MDRREERRLVACLFIDVVGSTELTMQLARFWAALAEAIREEVARDRGGPEPKHAGLRAIGYVGWSELLSARVSVN
jgi:class 3 adenylate cyclase